MYKFLAKIKKGTPILSIAIGHCSPVQVVVERDRSLAGLVIGLIGPNSHGSPICDHICWLSGDLDFCSQQASCTFFGHVILNPALSQKRRGMGAKVILSTLSGWVLRECLIYFAFVTAPCKGTTVEVGSVDRNPNSDRSDVWAEYVLGKLAQARGCARSLSADDIGDHRI